MFPHKDVGVILVPREYVDVLLLGGSCWSAPLIDLLAEGPWFVFLGLDKEIYREDERGSIDYFCGGVEQDLIEWRPGVKEDKGMLVDPPFIGG